MKKFIMIAFITCGLAACAQSTAPKEDNRLKNTYSTCINSAEGNPVKLKSCQGVLDELKQDKKHAQFTKQESVRVLDYQKCIQATRTGNDQEVKTRCDEIWKEIRSKNTEQ